MIPSMAVDCCWVVQLDDPTHSLFDMVHFLAAYDAMKVSLLLDHGRHIHDEYERNVTGLVGRKFFQTCLLRGRVEFHSGDLTARQVRALDAIGFDPSDRPYLAVASRAGSSPYLTTESKHLDPSQVAAIFDAVGVEVLSTDTALARLRADA